MFSTAKHATHAQVAWASAVTRYKIADALYRANDAFGRGKAANEEHDREVYAGEQACGTFLAASKHPVFGPRMAAALTAANAADDRAHYEIIKPADAAAIMLALTPAPDADALLFKVEVIARYELDNHRDFPGNPFDHIEAEAKRLAGEVA